MMGCPAQQSAFGWHISLCLGHTDRRQGLRLRAHRYAATGLDRDRMAKSLGIGAVNGEFRLSLAGLARGQWKAKAPKISVDASQTGKGRSNIQSPHPQS
jgi:hypothetical protein